MEMEDKKTSPTQKIRGIGCTVTVLFTILGTIIAPTVFIIALLSSPEYQNAPGAMGLLVFGTLPFFPVGAVGGAILGVVISGVIALVRKFGQTRGDTPRAPQSVLKSWTGPRSRGFAGKRIIKVFGIIGLSALLVVLALLDRSTNLIAIVIGLLLVGNGIYAIVKGKIPQMVFGDKGYKTEETGARVIGAILLIPIPLMIWDSIIGFVSIVMVLFTVYFINKAVRQPIE
jgi:hypothetical protein